MILFLQDILEL